MNSPLYMEKAAFHFQIEFTFFTSQEIPDENCYCDTDESHLVHLGSITIINFYNIYLNLMIRQSSSLK